jgi:hypothetical protein
MRGRFRLHEHALVEFGVQGARSARQERKGKGGVPSGRSSPAKRR